MKKAFSIVLCAVLLLALVAGCSKSTTTTTAAATDTTATTAAASTASSEAITITYQTPSKSDMFVTAFTEYEKTHPNVTLDVEVAPNDTYNAKTVAAASTGSVPDVMWWQGRQYVGNWSTGAWLDLTQYFNTTFKDRFVDGTFLMSVTDDGVNTCFPCEMQIQGFLVDTALFQQYNVAVPETFDDALTAAKTFRDNGLTLVCNGTGDTWQTWGWYHWFELWGVNEEASDIYSTHTLKFADSDARTALDKLIELYNAGGFPDNNATITYDMTCTNFLAQKGAMMTTSADWLTNIIGTDLDNAGSIQYSFGWTFPDSKYDQNTCVKMCGNGYGISSKIDQAKLDVLLDFFDWFYSNEGANIAIKQGQVLPINDFTLTADISPLVQSLMDLTLNTTRTGIITTDYAAIDAWGRNTDIWLQCGTDLSDLVNGCINGTITKDNIGTYLETYDADIDTAIAAYAAVK